MAIANYFLNYHELVLSRILSKKTKLYPHQEEAILAIYQKACRGEMDFPTRQAALILAGVGTGKTLIQVLTPYILAPWLSGEKALFLSDNCTLRARFLRDFYFSQRENELKRKVANLTLKITNNSYIRLFLAI